MRFVGTVTLRSKDPGDPVGGIRGLLLTQCYTFSTCQSYGRTKEALIIRIGFWGPIIL